MKIVLERGQTPLDEEIKRGLIPNLTLQKELDDVEFPP